AARERAKFLRREIDAGKDPLLERKEARTAPRVSDLINRYIEEHVPKLAPRHGSDQVSILKKRVEPEIGHMLLDEVTPGHIDRLLRKVAEGRPRPHKANPKRKRKKPLAAARPTPIRANRVGEVVRKMF